MRIAIVSASLSESSSSAALGHRIAERLAELSPVPTSEDWIELRGLAHPLMNSVLQGFAAPEVEAAQKDLQRADAVVAVTPVYQASYSGLFKIFFDVLPDGLLADKPVLLAATGGTGRHSLVIDHALRPLFAHLRALPTPVGVFAATQDWGDPGLEASLGDEEELDSRIDRAARQLCRLCGVDPAGRPATAGEKVEESFPGFVDFETLLRQGPELP